MIVIYASSHGWGHNMRLVPIINELFEYNIELVTTAPEWLIQTSMTRSRRHKVRVRHLKTDPGAVQANPFEIDTEKTIESWRDTFRNYEQIVKSEVELLKKRGNVRLIISDISFIGQLVAEHLKVQSICVATFDWAFIHRDLMAQNSEFSDIIHQIQDISARFDFCIIPGPACLPLNIGKKQLSFDWVSRKPTVSRPDMRDKLGLALHMDSALISLGGHAVMKLPKDVWSRFDNFQFFVLVPNSDLEEPPAGNVHFLPSEKWSGLHVDLVNTVDVVIGKLGYGLCSEVLHCRGRILAVDRPGNPECAVLKKAVAPVVPYAEMSEEDFFAGNWYKLNELVDRERNSLDYSECRTDGEVQIAKTIRNILGDREPFYFDRNAMVKWLVLVVGVLIVVFLRMR